MIGWDKCGGNIRKNPMVENCVIPAEIVGEMAGGNMEKTMEKYRKL